eukprot:jgi/Mesvir1/19331/Mv10389-RA.3
MEFSGFPKGGIHLNGPGGLLLGPEWGMSLWVETSNLDSSPNAVFSGEGPNHRFEVQIHRGAVVVATGPPMKHVVKEQYFKFPGGGPWSPHSTGAQVPVGGWHHIALSLTGGTLRVVVDNGQSRGEVNARHFAVAFGQVLGAGGSGHFWGYGSRSPLTGAVAGIKVCTHPSLDGMAQLNAKKAAWAPLEKYLVRVRSANQGWLQPLQGRRLLIIGNSARIMSAKVQLGSTIDKFDVVFRFNSNPVKGYEPYVGIKRTFDVANDFRDVCGCMKGECCSREKQALFWEQIATSQERPGSVLRFEGSGFDGEGDWVRRGLEKHGGKIVMADGPHMCGLFMYPWLEAHGVGARIPTYISCRTGMRLIGILLVSDMPFTVAGFDTEEKEYLSYSGHKLTRHSRPGGAYPQEQTLMSELFRLNAFEDIERITPS